MKNRYPTHEDDMPDNQILILGISPGFAVDPPSSKTGQRVRRWFEACGISEEEYDWRNLVDEAGAVPRMGDIMLNRYEVANYETVICLGNQPSRWCESLRIPHLKVPHPSGINRKWNDPNTEPTVMRQIADYVQETKGQLTV